MTTHHFKYKRLVVVLIATTLMLLPFTQLITCANNSRSGTGDKVKRFRTQQTVASVPVIVQPDASPANARHCHSQASTGSVLNSGNVGKLAASSCQCDHHCCQYGMVNAAFGHYRYLVSDVRSAFVIPVLTTLKPDFLSFPQNPPPITG
jgi:hypothetical protein